MRKYLTSEDFSVRTSFQIDSSLSMFEIELKLPKVRTEKTPVVDIGIGGTVATSPIVHEGMVYFGVCDKKFYAVNAETGEMSWSFPTEGPIAGSPTLEGDVVYFGSYDNNFYALTLEGRLKWKFPTQGKIFSKPCIYKGFVYFGSLDGNFYALDAQSGKEKWRFRTGGPILSWPEAYGDAVFFGSNDCNFYSLTLDGKLRWKFRTNREAGVFNSVIHNGIVYFGSFDFNMYALKAGTGSLIWKFTLSEPPNTVIARKDNFLFFGSRNCNFYAITTEGRQMWKFTSGQIAGGGVSVFGEVVYFGSSDNHLYAFDAKSGRLFWKFPAGGPVAHTNPAFHDGKVYFGCWDCNLYCITMNGRLVWKFRTSMSTPAPIFLPSEKEVTFETIWTPQFEEEEHEKIKPESEFKNYGKIGSEYGSGISKDYIKGKKGYVH